MPIFDKLQGTSSNSFSIGRKKPADPSAALQVDSTSRGILPPRMTTAQRTAIAAPLNGLVVYDTTINRLYCYEGGIWRALSLEPDSIYSAVTAGLVSGQFVYISANNVASPTDAANLSTSRCGGAFFGEAGWIRYAGIVTDAQFSAASSVPAVGSAVYLARADDEPLGGAAGKLTADKPSPPTIEAEVGIVVSVNPVSFPFTRIAKVLVQIKKIVFGASGGVHWGVTPIGPINNVNKVFTTPTYFDPAMLAVYYNGERMWEGVADDYVISESGGPGTGYDTITMAFAPKAAPGNPDKIMVDYMEI